MSPFFSAVLFAALLPIASAASLNAQPSAFDSAPLASSAPADTQCANLASAPDGTLYLTYYGPAPTGRSPNSNLRSPALAERTLYLSSLAPKATAFSAPRPIVTTPLLMENWADFASLCVGTDGALTAQWFQSDDSGGHHSYAGWFARSTDAGATWTNPAPLGHEFVALAPLSGGRTLTVWLESTRKHTPGASHKKSSSPASDSQLSAINSQLPPAPYAPAMKLMARLLSPDGATLGDWTVDADVCTCCQNTVAVLPGDRVFVAYRGHTADEIRDNKFTTFDLSPRTWSAPATLKDDHWIIPACPVNGPAADARDSSVAVAWFTAADGVARVQARTSPDSGKTFTTPVVVDLGHPMGRIETVMLADHSAVVLWMEMKSETNAAGIYARRLFPDGVLSAPQLIADTTQARAAGFPRAALRPNGHIVMSWTQTGEPNQVRTLTFDPAPLNRSATPTLTVRGGTGTAGPGVLELCVTPLASLH
jgi:hypothetical protein